MPGNDTAGILGRLAEVLGRLGDLSPIAPAAERLVWAANRDRLLQGLDPRGDALAPLRPSTLADRRRKGCPPGPPLLRHGEASRAIAGCRVDAFPGPGRLEVAKSWPTVPFMQFHISGTPTMPRRDPSGFGGAEVAELLKLAAAYALRGDVPDGR